MFQSHLGLFLLMVLLVIFSFLVQFTGIRKKLKPDTWTDYNACQSLHYVLSHVRACVELFFFFKFNIKQLTSQAC